MVFPQKPSLIRLKNSCEVEILCPAKLNLYLNVIGPYPGGYHQIQSIVGRISLFDKLKIKLLKEDTVRIVCNDKTLENEENLCVKAAISFKKRFRIKKGFLIYLEKKIPPGSGLGGGSSDAAFTLIGIDRLLSLNISISEFYQLGQEIGSDVNFFLSQSSFSLIEGRGEKVIPLDIPTSVRYLLIYPGFRLSSRLVYKYVKPKLTKFVDNVNIIIYALKKRDFRLLEYGLFNALEKSAFKVCSSLNRYRDFLKSNNFVMTGSGSAFFLILRDKKISTRSLRKIFKQGSVFQVHSF